MFNLTQLLEEQKIEIRECLDQIRWGYKPPGKFKVKEAANLATRETLLPAEKK
jgi:hypothetical protein